MRRRLPLRRIGVFEAVARLGSFKAAAQELHLTPSAVSHQIRTLEIELGVELFTRTAHGVALSPDTTEFAERVGGILADLRQATEEITARGAERSAVGAVRIMTPPSLATHWLMPRLPAFIETYPGIDMRVFAVRTADGKADDFDITIGYGDAKRYAKRASPFLQEVIQPYCAPSRLGGLASFEAQDLLAHPLIQSRENAHSWETWFDAHDVAVDRRRYRPLQIDPSYVAIEAAVKGIGVVLESSLLTQEHVDSGQLVAPVPEADQAAVAYWLLPLRPGARRVVEIAHDWLRSQTNLDQFPG